MDRVGLAYPNYLFCSKSKFACSTYPLIIHEGVEDLSSFFFVFFLGGRVGLAYLNYMFASCPNSHVQHHFLLIIHEGVEDLIFGGGGEVDRVGLAYQNYTFSLHVQIRMFNIISFL